MGSVDGDAYLDGAATRRGFQAIVHCVRELKFYIDWNC
jgi:hypothetical protein